MTRLELLFIKQNDLHKTHTRGNTANLPHRNLLSNDTEKQAVYVNRMMPAYHGCRLLVCRIKELPISLLEGSCKGSVASRVSEGIENACDVFLKD